PADYRICSQPDVCIGYRFTGSIGTHAGQVVLLGPCRQAVQYKIQQGNAFPIFMMAYGKHIYRN
ncbi:MAG TPA: hypothetical protein PKD90_16730, partial [Phnomibacter sp.]|nr:hypothetical protein [Phnomibacter sp.]